MTLAQSEPETSPARRLLGAEAVRERCGLVHEAVLAGRGLHFTLDPERLPDCADRVVETIRADYPMLDIPFHARWRHFATGGFDRWGTLAQAAPWPDPETRARAAFDLATVSVLLDAGAGPDWRYEEGRTGETFARSEGLAVASVDMFVGGMFSSRPDEPWRVDAAALIALTPDELARGLQLRIDNPLVGLENRAALLNRLGAAVEAAPDIFGRLDDPRPGGLFDLLATEARNGMVAAPDVLAALLAHLGSIWPGRIALDGLALGDTWRHPLAETDDGTSGLVPFHKLSQWLAYSLLEPLEEAGLAVTGVNGLTGLPEYRNGGLFMDTGVIRLRDPAEAETTHEVGSTLVVEWRALTVALLDRVAPLVRDRLGLDEAALPLARVLEGGTWATGRRLAATLRPGGAPPFRIASDGTVF